MGMPVTPDTYEVLAALAEGSPLRDNAGIDAVREMLDRFPVVALVLYDPSVHTAFAQALGAGFIELDERTRGQVAFFALVSDDALFRHIRFRRRDDLFVAALRDRGGGGRLYRAPRAPSELSEHTLAMAMTAYIPYAALPCVMFTTRLDAPSWSWVSVTPSSLVPCFDALVRLTRSTRDLCRDPASRAWWVARRLSSDPAVQSEDHEPYALSEAQRSTVPPFGETHASRRLASALADTLAIAHGRRPRHGLGHRNLWPQGVPHAPSPMSAEARLLRQEPLRDHDAADPLDELLLDALLARLAAGSGHVRRTHPWMADLEPEAQAALRTAQFLIDQNLPGLDTGIAVAALGKALEVAANGTAIQSLRHAHGVTMPPYFRSHDPGRGAIPIRIHDWGGDSHVELNERRTRERWHALTLAEIKAVLKEDGWRLPHLDEEVRDLRTLSKGLGPLRNHGAHVGGVEPHVARDHLQCFHEHGQRGLFARLAAAVARLRS